MPKLTMGEDSLALTFNGYRDFQQHEAAVKAVPGRRYDGEAKAWNFPKTPDVAERLFVTVKPEVSADVLSWVKSAKSDAARELVTPLPEDADTLVPWGKTRVPWQPEKVGKKGEEVPFKGLFSYQRAFAASAGEGKPSRVAKLLADDMGLGKCGQASSAFYEWMLSKSAFASSLDMPLEAFQSATDMILWAGLDDGPKLVVSPSSVKGTWARELRMWLGEEIPIHVIDGSWTPKKRKEAIKDAIENNGWVIINWEQLRVKKTKKTQRTKMLDPWTKEFIGWKNKEVEVEGMREPLFEDTEWQCIIADEAHRAKNRKSLQTKGLWRIDAPFKLALTGTPLMNTPDELWPILKWLYPEEYTSYWRFFDTYVDYYEGQYGKIITGVKNADALRFELAKRLVRRTKGEVLDLPEKMRQYRPIKLNKKQEKLYREAEKELWFEVEKAIKEGDESARRFAEAAERGTNLYTVPNGASRIVRLRQIASTPALLGGEDDSAKLDAAVEIILDAKKQIVVFSEFVGTCHALVERLRAEGVNAEAFTGGVESEDRTRLENEFQEGNIDVIVGTIGAMKEGITLTAADTVIFIERHWTPAVNEQCEDRLHRVGQRNNVTVIILEAEDTVDTGNVSVANAIKHLIVTSVIQKDDVREEHHGSTT